MTLQSEANQQKSIDLNKTKSIDKFTEYILEGKWKETEQLVQKLELKQEKAILYQIYKQQYLELIEAGQYQKALSFLMKKLKPLEEMATFPNEFKDLSYLLTCTTVQEVPLFKSWDGMLGKSREILLDSIKHILKFEIHELGEFHSLPPKRLLTLIEQSLCYQIQTGSNQKTIPKIETLLQDYEHFIIPNQIKKVFTKSHTSNIKTIEFIGHIGNYIASGGNDNTIKIWNTNKGESIVSLQGHTSKIWSLHSSKSGNLLASGSGDSTIKIWDFHYFPNQNPKCLTTITKQNSSDIYSVRIHPDEKQIISSGYDNIISHYEIESGKLLKQFSGHSASVCSIVFNPYGNIIVSGSKDCTLKFWDLRSGLCIKTYSEHLGEITSVEFDQSGTKLLSCSKDNTNRLWDLRSMQPIQKFKGHQNNYKNHIKSSFGSNEKVVYGGSEDGIIYCWDILTSKIVEKLSGHSGVVYQAIWNSKQGILASCGEDKLIRTWNMKE